MSRCCYGHLSSQPGSFCKAWDKEELIRCGAIGTTKRKSLDLEGHVHPIFTNWVETDHELRTELEQPLLLASKILEATGLPWISDFLVDDIFDDSYPGREPKDNSRWGFGPREGGPRTIVRHQRASWTSPDLQEIWIQSTDDHTRDELAKAITWQLDTEMFQEKGWIGYTCRHPRGKLKLDELDKYETIEKWDRLSKNRRYRNLTILLMVEYPARLAELTRQGRADSEEYLLTAFMTTVTLLHEIGHAAYWKDFRSLTRDLQEPFYGADLEMELGDSFVSYLFGGWIPVPIREFSRLQEDFSFEDGLSWRQSLSWDHHRLRPKHRAHHSIPIDYIAGLFDQERWSSTVNSDYTSLIRPSTLKNAALETVGIAAELTYSGKHATAAIPDFYCTGEGYRWNRRPGAWFRIPQYDGHVCPDIDLPYATDDVIKEAHARNVATLSGQTLETGTSPRKFPWTTIRKTPIFIAPECSREDSVRAPECKSEKPKRLELPGTEEMPRVRLADKEKSDLLSSPVPSEISVDELKKRLSRLIGVSLTELETLFEGPQCT